MRQLAEAWTPLDPLLGTYYAALEVPPQPAAIRSLQDVFGKTSGDEPPELLERVAELCSRSAFDGSAKDGLRWVRACLGAEHLGAGVAAWSTVGAATREQDDYLDVARCRGLLGELAGTPSLELPGPAELEEISSLTPSQAFDAWVLAARSGVRAGAIQQARRYLDHAEVLSRSARLTGRTLFRLVECEWHIAGARRVSQDAYLEVLTRWCEHGGGENWYDDATAVILLADLGELPTARQFLVACEAVHNRTGLGQLWLLGCRLHLELTEFRIGPAVQVAEELNRHTLSSSLSAPRCTPTCCACTR